MFKNFDLDNLVTSVDYNKFEQLLKETKYNEEKTKRIVQGFKYEFPLGYQGKRVKYRNLYQISSCALEMKLTFGIKL